jgi:hypothetical protein
MKDDWETKKKVVVVVVVIVVVLAFPCSFVFLH